MLWAAVLLTRKALDAIKDGEVTAVFRRWRRPTVRSGGTLRTSIGVLAIDRVSEVALSEITEQDARRAGHASLSALLQTLTGREGTTYRIDVRFAGADQRIARREHDRLSADELREDAARLDRLDERSRSGAWTRDYLDAIASRPETPAAELARVLGVEKARFKGRVRKLKEIGLTISCSAGYRLSARGERVYANLRHRTQSDRQPP